MEMSILIGIFLELLFDICFGNLMKFDEMLNATYRTYRIPKKQKRVLIFFNT